MLRLYNSLSRQIEEFQPIQPPHVGMYTCGPTVYQYAHIGNFRAYMTADILVRVLKHNNVDVKFVMNITDVGHLVSDADSGEDKLEKSAKKEGKTAWDIADFYTDAFLKDYDGLGLTRPDILAKATDHIKEQIELIKRLEEKGFTYVIQDGVYFDTSKLADYGKLSTLDQIKEGVRVEVNEEKRNPRDFALWKFSYPSGRSFDSAQDGSASRRHMEWESPWGVGFPGWHIECSAMSMKYLTDVFDPSSKLRVDGAHNATIDIHTGGVDHISIHHTNEIAQSEAATDKKFVNYWVHTAFMLVQGQKMSKSLGNTYKLSDLVGNGYQPIHLRYLYLQTHYRQEMNFTWESLEAAKTALERLINSVAMWDKGEGEVSKKFEEKFLDALNDDLNTPQALAVVWELMKSEIKPGQKRATLLRMDEVLGLGLQRARVKQEAIPEAVQSLLDERQKARAEKDFTHSDELRDQIVSLGFEVMDTHTGQQIKPRH